MALLVSLVFLASSLISASSMFLASDEETFMPNTPRCFAGHGAEYDGMQYLLPQDWDDEPRALEDEAIVSARHAAIWTALCSLAERAAAAESRIHIPEAVRQVQLEVMRPSFASPFLLE